MASVFPALRDVLPDAAAAPDATPQGIELIQNVYAGHLLVGSGGLCQAGNGLAPSRDNDAGAFLDLMQQAGQMCFRIKGAHGRRLFHKASLMNWFIRVKTVPSVQVMDAVFIIMTS